MNVHLPVFDTLKMSKAIFKADQLETLLSRVLATAMENFEACMDKMLDKLLDKFETRIEKLVGDLSTANCRIDKVEQALNARDQVRAQEAAFQHITVGSTSAAAPSVTWSDQAVLSTVKQPPISAVTIRVGKRPAGDSVKAIKPPLTCFVGRLDPETTADDLKHYLEEVGIKDADCWKLQAKDGRLFKTAAFRVSCSEEFRDLLHDETTWPEGAELRDWVYRQRVPIA